MTPVAPPDLGQIRRKQHDEIMKEMEKDKHCIICKKNLKRVSVLEVRKRGANNNIFMKFCNCPDCGMYFLEEQDNIYKLYKISETRTFLCEKTWKEIPF